MGYFGTRPGAMVAASSTFTTGLGIALTGAAINTKGAYTDIIASTTMAAGHLLVELQPSGITGGQALVDIAVGSAGSEDVIISNLGVNTGSGFSVHSIIVPYSIPKGSTIRARYQRNNASLTMRCSVKVFGTLDPPHTSLITTYGADTATSRGTPITVGASANVKSSWVEVSAGTTVPHRWVLLHLGNQANTARTDAGYLVDIGIGSAGSEDIMIPDLLFLIDDALDEPNPNYIGPLPLHITEGTRIAVRASSTITDATDRLFDVILYGGS